MYSLIELLAYAAGFKIIDEYNKDKNRPLKGFYGNNKESQSD